MPHRRELVLASVTPHSKDGHSIHDADRIDATNIRDFEPDPKRRAVAARHLRALGFEVHDHGGSTLSVGGPKELFEKTFSQTLVERGRRVGPGPHDVARFFHPETSDIPGLIPLSSRRHRDLASVAKGLALAEPVHLFASASKTPPQVKYPHFELPDGLAKALRANAAHRAGITGAGVKVAICDSGFYAHPWFTTRGLNVRVKVTPGAGPASQDEVGHGTMVAANLLSVAPGCDVTMVKMDFTAETAGVSLDAIAALGIARRSGARIINCSWGMSIATRTELTAFTRTLEYSVAQLVAEGRIFVSASGNYPRTQPHALGDFGFPAQHPDAFAVGGVFSEANGRIRAASYASGFRSRLYPDRTVPDICGLCGNAPAGVLIMSPVQPGCLMDVAGGQRRYPNGDDTRPDDGWCCASGTSAATPQVAGVVALMLQVNANLAGTEAVRRIIELTARDVTTGRSNSRAVYPTGSNIARSGPDVATGAGLVNASAAVLLAATLACGEQASGTTFIKLLNRCRGTARLSRRGKTQSAESAIHSL